MFVESIASAAKRVSKQSISLLMRCVKRALGGKATMRNRTLTRIIFILSISIICFATANAQKSGATDERDEYCFPTITCGPGWSTREYTSRSGEAILVTERHYESEESVDEAIEARVKSVDKIIERGRVSNEKGESQGLRVVAQVADKTISFERSRRWLISTQARSLESLRKFEAYLKKQLER